MPAWTDSATDDTLDVLGFTGRGDQYDPETNFGLTRVYSALPTTDPARLQAYIDRELARRAD